MRSCRNRGQDLSDLVLVGHSYGGMVVTGVADAIPDKIASLVYLDAFVAENGKALVAVASGRPGTARPSLIRSVRLLRLLLRTVLLIPGAVWLAPVPPLESIGEPSEAFRDFVARKASPHPLACFTQASRLTGGIERIRRKTYIYCNDPQPTTFTPLYEKLRHEPGWTVHTLPCSHWPQLDMPEALTVLLLRHAAVD